MLVTHTCLKAIERPRHQSWIAARARARIHRPVNGMEALINPASGSGGEVQRLPGRGSQHWRNERGRLSAIAARGRTNNSTG